MIQKQVVGSRAGAVARQNILLSESKFSPFVPGWRCP